MKLKRDQIKKLFEAHKALTTYVCTVNVGGAEVNDRKPYLFDKDCTLAILANRKALRLADEEFWQAFNDLIKQISGGDRVETDEHRQLFVDALKVVADVEHDIPLKMLRMTDLNPGMVNPIPTDVLDNLELVLQD